MNNTEAERGPRWPLELILTELISFLTGNISEIGKFLSERYAFVMPVTERIQI